MGYSYPHSTLFQLFRKVERTRLVVARIGPKILKKTKTPRSGAGNPRIRKINFKIKDNQSLVIIYCLLPDAGLERIIVENKKGITHVYADGRSRFEFSNQKEHPNQCDFWLSNPKESVMIEDIIRSKFWQQFTWGELVTAQKNHKLNKALNRKIRKLVKEFEEKTAQQLNQLHKQHKNGSKK